MRHRRATWHEAYPVRVGVTVIRKSGPAEQIEDGRNGRKRRKRRGLLWWRSSAAAASHRFASKTGRDHARWTHDSRVREFSV